MQGARVQSQVYNTQRLFWVVFYWDKARKLCFALHVHAHICKVQGTEVQRPGFAVKLKCFNGGDTLMSCQIVLSEKRYFV